MSLAGGALVDTQPPALTLSNPANGSLVSQPITVTATASDGSGIAKVQLYVDNQLVATKIAAPYTYGWNTNASTDGPHAIKAVATDGAGRTNEQTANITLARILPAADTSGPALASANSFLGLLSNGLVFTRSGNVSVTASDPSGIARVDLLLDGSAVATATGSGTYTAQLNIDNVANGPHTLALAGDRLARQRQHPKLHRHRRPCPAARPRVEPARQRDGRQDGHRRGVRQRPGRQRRTSAGQWRGLGQPRHRQGRTGASPPRLLWPRAPTKSRPRPPTSTAPAPAPTPCRSPWTTPSRPAPATWPPAPRPPAKYGWPGAAPPTPARSATTCTGPSSAFDAIASAAKVNAAPLAATAFDDLPPQDGTWTYRVVAINKLGTPSAPSNLAQAVSDNTLPRAVSIAYTPQGHFDPDTGLIGQGPVDILLTSSEELPSTPFLSIVPLGGTPIPVALTPSGTTTYTGSLIVSSKTPPGPASALYSARDAVGNRGTDIDSGATLKFDTAGPALSGIELDPATPIDSAAHPTVKATFTFSKPPKACTTGQRPVVGRQAGRPSPWTGLAKEDDITWAGDIALPEDAGRGSPESLTFSFKAVDALDNESTKVLADNRFQVYQGNLPPLDVPFALTAKPSPRARSSWPGKRSSRPTVTSFTASPRRARTAGPHQGHRALTISTRPQQTAATNTPSPRAPGQRPGSHFRPKPASNRRRQRHRPRRTGRLGPQAQRAGHRGHLASPYPRGQGRQLQPV